MTKNTAMQTPSPISIAPMMDWTDKHCRYFLRLLNPTALLYTEMVTAAAVHHGDTKRFLSFNDEEHPLALQLGGNDPVLMASACEKANAYGYDEININVGCPSDRVQSGQFGACLMANPDVVAACYQSMCAVSDAPITVKTRIGIDDQDSDEFLRRFVDTLATAGCRKFVVHARIAILQGLSPKQNRSVPPLNYERVFRLKRDFPELEIVLNGGLTDVDGIEDVLRHVDGAMIGRQAYNQPFFLAQLQQHFDPDWRMPQRAEIVNTMLPYVDEQVSGGVPFGRISRHLLALFSGQPGARAWRRVISQQAHVEGAGSEVLLEALNAMPLAA